LMSFAKLKTGFGSLFRHVGKMDLEFRTSLRPG
jgi:hypothetical protein